MEARLESPLLFRKILDAIRELVEEANIDCNQSGISLQAMDSSHVALVAMHLSAKGFDSFKCDEPVTLGVNLGSILKILKCGDANDVLTLRTNEENSELKFQFENQGRLFEFSMALIDLDTDHLAIPEAEPQAAVTMSSSEFQRICRDLQNFGDNVKICVAKNTVTFSVNGATGNGSVTLGSFESTKGDSEIVIKLQSGDDEYVDKVEQTFGLKYLNFFAKASPLSQNVALELSNDRPLVASFQLEDDAGSIKYYLAPKVDDDEGAED